MDKFYREHSDDYINPHIHDIEKCIKHLIPIYNIGENILDMCCGKGEVTKIIQSITTYINVDGLDPFTYEAYKKETGNECIQMTFKDIVCGSLVHKRYDTIFCSYAMHLCEESMLNSLLYNISLICDTLVIITPHKRPNLSKQTYFIEHGNPIKYNKSTLKVYRSWVNNGYQDETRDFTSQEI